MYWGKVSFIWTQKEHHLGVQMLKKSLPGHEDPLSKESHKQSLEWHPWQLQKNLNCCTNILMIIWWYHVTVIFTVKFNQSPSGTSPLHIVLDVKSLVPLFSTSMPMVLPKNNRMTSAKIWNYTIVTFDFSA